MLPIFFITVCIFAISVVVLYVRSCRNHSLRLIQMELDKGKKMYFKDACVGGRINGVRYNPPYLILAVFDDCLIFKDKKILFSDIESIDDGGTIRANDGQSMRPESIFLQFIPKEHGGQKGSEA